MKKIRPDFKKFTAKHKQGLFLLGVFSISILSIPYGYRFKNRNDPVIMGVSFSVKYAEELGLDWKKTYLAMLDDLGIKHLRLMSYWDVGEAINDNYNFDDLDWQLDQAQRHGADVTLAVGQRQPRWPECHIPKWADELDQKTYRRELLEYITVVVDRYKDDSTVISYQVENEASNTLFGICDEYDPEFLAQEIQLVKKLDPGADVITNVSSQNGLTLRGPVNHADRIGFSIYHNAHFETFGQTYGWRFLFPSQWHSYRAAVLEGVKGKDIFVHELQAEPWGPEATVNLSSEEQAKTMNPDQLRAIVEYTKQTGIKEMYLWGGEWWYWRYTNFNDRELWDVARDLYR